MTHTLEQLGEAVTHISFEMNRFLCLIRPVNLPKPYSEAIAESCLLHSRNIGEFFFEDKYKDNIKISHYYNVLMSKNELEEEIKKSKPEWVRYKQRINRKLGHLTYKRLYSEPMNVNEKDAINFEVLIAFFEKNLPPDFKEKWERGKLIGGNSAVL